ncbi:hypothetical protein [Arundinibacter roseus]|uniref:Uncharacterized protein n=1 Tax=Arundinibacter roseus TaxID=2070510 RepID=A0A4R4KCS0_9BACT|nr:hypothetical protein [Arundinibacter roseus]TDB64642.1 hypothetical protein EZE20_13310 [Arundinibacter roseus]
MKAVESPQYLSIGHFMDEFYLIQKLPKNGEKGFEKLILESISSTIIMVSGIILQRLIPFLNQPIYRNE